MAETHDSAIGPYTVRVVAEDDSWTVWPGAIEGVCLQVHGLSGDVLEVTLGPVLDAPMPDHLTLRVYRLRPEGAGWEALYDGPLVPLAPRPVKTSKGKKAPRRPHR